VNIELEPAAEPLNHGHGAAPPVAHTAAAGPAAIEAQDGADVDSEHRAAELVVPGEEVAQAVGQGQHPLAHGDMREHGVHEVCGQLRHAPPATARTEAPSLAGERHESLEGAAFAPDACEAPAENATRQELTKFALDELRQATAVAARGDLGAKGLEMFADDPMEDGALHGPGLVAGGAHARWLQPGTCRPGFDEGARDPSGTARRIATGACNIALPRSAPTSEIRCGRRRSLRRSEPASPALRPRRPT